MKNYVKSIFENWDDDEVIPGNYKADGKMRLATVITMGDFGPIVTKCKLVEYGYRKYAQYRNAAFVKYIPKGKRTVTGFIKGYQPYIIILAGHHDVDMDGMDDWDSGTGNPDVKWKKSRYMSFDPRYSTDYDSFIDKYIESLGKDSVLFDERWTKKDK